MVDWYEGQVPGQSQALGSAETDQEAAYESGLLRHSHRIQVADPDPGLAESLPDHRLYRVHVGAACHLRNHASERGVQGNLGRNHVG